MHHTVTSRLLCNGKRLLLNDYLTQITSRTRQSSEFFQRGRKCRLKSQANIGVYTMLHHRPCATKNTTAMLPFRLDRFNGAVVDLVENRPDVVKNQELFLNCLESSLESWMYEQRPAAWLKIPMDLGHLISPASKVGFKFHHAEDDYAMLFRWLGQGENRIPHYATHQMGVSGFVINENTKEVLMVQDKHRIARWKFPGGYSNIAEDIPDTAVREVHEETGIKAEFQSILAFRQQHKLPYNFEKSDIYVICRLKPLTFDLNICKTELMDARWFPVDDLLNSEDHTLLTRRIVELIKFGFDNGFSAVDITVDELNSVYKNATYKLFHRPITSAL